MKKLFYSIRHDELSLEQTIFFLTAMANIFMSAVGTVTNIPLGLGPMTVIGLLINILLNICCIVYSYRTGKWFIPSILVVVLAAFVIFPILWFSSGGAVGSTTPYIIMSGLIAVILYRGNLRNFFLILIPLLFSAFISLEMFYPEIIIPYQSRATHYIDLIIGLVTSFSATGILAAIVLSRYRKANLQAEELAKKLGEISITDPLTGIYNRRMLTSCLDEEMRKCYENNSPLTICLIDIDHFKRVNDNYGHLCGDRVLIDLARILNSFMGENDILGRYGGEEFLVISKSQSLHTALNTVEQFHRAVREHSWGEVPHLTISCGVSGYVKGISYSQFVGDADKYLYEAKESGRDRIAYKTV